MSEFFKDYLYHLLDGWTPFITAFILLGTLLLTGKSASSFSGAIYFIWRFVVPFIVAFFVPIFAMRKK